MKYLAGLLAGILILCGGLMVLPLYESPPVDPAWEVPASTAIASGAVTVRFTGTSTLLFSDGETAWLVDGWFTRVSPLRLAFGKIAPDQEAISYGLAANEIDQLAAVIPVHSHYDHAMDSAEVAKRTGALLMGSESTANIGRGWNLPESRIRVFDNWQPVQIGDFTITPIESRHFQFPQAQMRERALQNPQIKQPLVPPVGAFDYRLGKAYILHVVHPKGSFAVVGSAGYVDDALRDLRADVVFLGVGGLGSQTSSYRDAYWRETVGMLQPKRVVPIHFDSLTAPIKGPFRGPVLLMSLLSPGNSETLSYLRDMDAANPAITFEVLPRFDEVVLFN